MKYKKVDKLNKDFVVNSIAYKNLRAGWKHLYLYAKEKKKKLDMSGGM